MLQKSGASQYNLSTLRISVPVTAGCRRFSSGHFLRHGV